VLLLSKTINQFVGDGIDYTKFRETLQYQVDNLTPSSPIKDVLLISKSLESSASSITTSDILLTGNNQIASITSFADEVRDDILLTGNNQIASITSLADDVRDDILLTGNNQIASITSLADDVRNDIQSIYEDDISLKAPLASPALTGTPTAPTAASSTSTTQIATTEFVRTEITNLVDSSPSTLDTLNELAAALGDDPNFATTVATSIGTKADASVVSSHTGNTSNPHSVTKTQVGLGSVDNTADSAKNVLGATKLTTARTIGLSGDVSGSASFDGSANATITATVADDSHNHVISNVDGLQTALNGKLSTTGKAADADKLDGIDSTGFVQTAGSTMSGLLATKTNNASFAGSNDTTFSVRGSTSYPAAMSFHRAGAYGVNFGLDTDNKLKVGGWSMGGVHEILHTGNVTLSGTTLTITV